MTAGVVGPLPINDLIASPDRPFVCDTLLDSLADTIFFVKNEMEP